MANSVIAGSLNFTWDTPCLNETGRLPVLDTCLWIGTQAREKIMPENIDKDALKITQIAILKNVILFYSHFTKSP